LLWHHDEWIKRGFAEGQICPAAAELAEQIFHLPPAAETIIDRDVYLQELDRLATNTVFATFSTGSLMLQHIRHAMLERLKQAHFSEEELSPILAKVGVVNIAPVYRIGNVPESVDFTHVHFINRLDPHASEGPKTATFINEVTAAAPQHHHSIYKAYETRLHDMVKFQTPLINPNLQNASEKTLGGIRINARNLILYGDSAVEKFPIRTRYSLPPLAPEQEATPASAKDVIVEENRTTHPAREHDLGLYLSLASTSAKGPAVVQSFQRYADAHLIPQALHMLVNNEADILEKLTKGVEANREMATQIFNHQEPLEVNHPKFLRRLENARQTSPSKSPHSS